VHTVAQLEFSPLTKTWLLYCYDRSAKRIPYSESEESPAIEPLLMEVDQDPTGIFWG
jgi:hypothetical protein